MSTPLLPGISGYAVRLVLLVGLALGAARPAPAQDREATFAQTADALIAEALRRVGTVPGLAVAVVHDGRTAYARGFGSADVEAGLPVTPDTPFYIASATKPFTALLAVLLDRDGTLALNASLASLFADVVFDPAIEADSVTVRHLLSHTAGIDNGPIGFRAAYTGQHTPAEMRRLLAETVVEEDAPRGTFEYTNVGYNLLSLRLDELAGGPWQALLADRLFGPLGMTHTTAVASEAAAWAPAVPYAVHPERGVERVGLVKHDDTMQAAGGMYASAADLARWLAIHLNEGRLDGQHVLPADVVAEAHRPLAPDAGETHGVLVRDGYALGWHTGTYDGEPMLHHLGGFPGAHAHTSFLPGRDLGVVVLANESSAGGRLATLVASFVYDAWGADRAERDAAVERTRRSADALRADVAAGLDRYGQALAERAGRTWELSLPPGAYAGSYVHPDWGTMVVEANPAEGSPLAVRFGRLHDIATAFPRPETARVELIPGRGQVLQFVLDDSHVRALVWDGVTFEREAP